MVWTLEANASLGWDVGLMSFAGEVIGAKTTFEAAGLGFLTPIIINISESESAKKTDPDFLVIRLVLEDPAKLYLRQAKMLYFAPVPALLMRVLPWT